MGSNIFCFKACDPSGPNAKHFCEHVFDRIGCQFNAPAAYLDGVFESCEGESQDFPGVYTDASGATQTYTQPPESLGPIQTMPYTARIPKSSNCVASSSAALYPGLPVSSLIVLCELVLTFCSRMRVLLLPLASLAALVRRLPL